MTGTRGVVIAAMIASVVIAAAKFAAYTVTGNVSMLSEAYHSVSDAVNQVLLLLGLRLSRSGPDRGHPFGHGKAQYFTAFIVSMLLFGVTGFAALREGWHRLGITYETGSPFINYAVLGVALAFESWALMRAYRELRVDMEAKEIGSYLAAYRDSKDATLLTAVTEDVLAVLGIVIAGFGVALTELTGDTVYDAVGSILIGVLLMSFSLVLAWENRGLILGESVSGIEREAVLTVMQADRDIVRVHDLRTVHFGTNTVLVAAEVEFADELDTDDIEAAIRRIEGRIRERLPVAKHIYIEARHARSPTKDGI